MKKPNSQSTSPTNSGGASQKSNGRSGQVFADENQPVYRPPESQPEPRTVDPTFDNGVKQRTPRKSDDTTNSPA